VPYCSFDFLGIPITFFSSSPQSLKITVTALVNDTVGTLATRAYRDPSCYVGVIFGTGTNAAYVEKASEVPKFKQETKTGKMVINMEWGSFDDNKQILPVTIYDLVLDRASPNPSKQVYTLLSRTKKKGKRGYMTLYRRLAL